MPAMAVSIRSSPLTLMTVRESSRVNRSRSASPAEVMRKFVNSTSSRRSAESMTKAKKICIFALIDI